MPMFFHLKTGNKCYLSINFGYLGSHPNNHELSVVLFYSVDPIWPQTSRRDLSKNENFHQNCNNIKRHLILLFFTCVPQCLHSFGDISSFNYNRCSPVPSAYESEFRYDSKLSVHPCVNLFSWPRTLSANLHVLTVGVYMKFGFPR